MASSDVRCWACAASWAKLTANLKTRESPQLSRKFLFDPSKGQSQQALSGFSLACFAAVNKLSLFWAVVFLGLSSPEKEYDPGWRSHADQQDATAVFSNSVPPYDIHHS